MNVIVNGTNMVLDDALNLVAVLHVVGVRAGGRGVAIALNGQVVPRAAWESCTVGEGDKLEVLSAAQGG